MAKLAYFSFILKEGLQRFVQTSRLFLKFSRFLYFVSKKRDLTSDEDAHLTFSTYFSNNQLSFVTSFFSIYENWAKFKKKIKNFENVL